MARPSRPGRRLGLYRDGAFYVSNRVGFFTFLSIAEGVRELPAMPAVRALEASS